MNAISQPRGGAHLRTAAGLAGALSVLMLAACASTPPAPEANLHEARQAIAAAEQAQAGHYAPGELNQARTKLQSANAAVTDNRMVSAERLAEESTADAELATAKTADVKAHSVNNEMQHSTSTLIDEIQRSSGDPQ